MARALLAVLLLLLPAVSLATEGGGTSRLPGLDTILAGVMSPPGTRFSTRSPAPRPRGPRRWSERLTSWRIRCSIAITRKRR